MKNLHAIFESPLIRVFFLNFWCLIWKLNSTNAMEKWFQTNKIATTTLDANPFLDDWRRCIITKRGRFTKSIWYLWLHAKNGSYLHCLVAFYRLWKEIMLLLEKVRLAVALEISTTVKFFSLRIILVQSFSSIVRMYMHFNTHLIPFSNDYLNCSGTITFGQIF